MKASVLSALFLSQNVLAGVVSIPFKRQNEIVRRTGTFNSNLANKVTLYTVAITLGTPPQTVNVQLDTGSSDLIVNSPTSTICTTDPSSCGTGAVYNANSSSTYQYIDSTLSQIYQDKTGGTGDYAKDVFSIGGATTTGFTFGITYKSTLTEGVLGVGYVALESDSRGYDNLPVLLVKQGLIARKVYSMYLNDAAATGGTLLLGGLDTAKYKGNLVTVPFLPEQDGSSGSSIIEFLVGANLISGTDSAGNAVTLGGGAGVVVLLDSGTTVTTLPAALVTSIYNFVGATAGTTRIPCSAKTDTKTINFAFGTGVINVSLKELIGDNGDGTCNFLIVPTDSGNPNILGDSVLRSMYVIFDLDKNVASIAPANFDATSSNVIEITPSLLVYPPGVGGTVQIPTTSSGGSPATTTTQSTTGGFVIPSITPSTTPITFVSTTGTAQTSAVGTGTVKSLSSTSTGVVVPSISGSSTATVAVAVPTSPSSAFAYQGCYNYGSSGSGVGSFVVIAQSNNMNVNLCLSTAQAGGFQYAALFGTSCYGGSSFNQATPKVSNAQCNLPCAGNSLQSCGGNGLFFGKRQVAIILSVYVQIALVVPSTTAPATLTTGPIFTPGIVFNPSINIILPTFTAPPVIISGAPIYLTIGQPYVQIVTTVYTGICGCAAGVAPITATSTVTLAYGCTAGCAASTIPMTTTTQLCSNCGPNNSPATVTLTVPAPVAPTGTLATVVTTTVKPSTYTVITTNGAGSLGVNGMVMVVSMLATYFIVY